MLIEKVRTLQAAGQRRHFKPQRQAVQPFARDQGILPDQPLNHVAGQFRPRLDAAQLHQFDQPALEPVALWFVADHLGAESGTHQARGR